MSTKTWLFPELAGKQRAMKPFEEWALVLVDFETRVLTSAHGDVAASMEESFTSAKRNN